MLKNKIHNENSQNKDECLSVCPSICIFLFLFIIKTHIVVVVVVVVIVVVAVLNACQNFIALSDNIIKKYFFSVRIIFVRECISASNGDHS